MSLKKIMMEKDLDCPRCFVKMYRVEVKKIGVNFEIDICPKCKGMYLDSGELHKLVKDKKLSDYLTRDIGTQSKSKLVCPRCGGLMDLEWADDIEVDVCLSCSGVWLDEGELDDLKDKSKEGFAGDDLEKAVERWEDSVEKNRKSRYNRFFGKLGR
jgi:Zn-finger nucleic acid-binding protein